MQYCNQFVASGVDSGYQGQGSVFCSPYTVYSPTSFFYHTSQMFLHTNQRYFFPVPRLQILHIHMQNLSTRIILHKDTT